jgi:hypothetical protein
MTTPSEIKENRERQEVLRNDQKVREQAATYHGFASAELAQPRGRFGEAEGKQFVVGSTPGPVYPKLPASSPWAHDPAPNEEPLGFRVDAMPELASPTDALAVSPSVATGPTSDAPSALLVEADVQRSDVGPFSPSKEETK